MVPTPQPEVLIVEDEQDLARLLAFNLTANHFRVRTASNGRSALDAIRERAPDLILLDLMLPDIPGKEICRLLKADAELSSIPIIMATACDSEIDRVVGFELGASDYVIKPFSLRELPLRVRAVLRRTQAKAPEHTVRLSDIKLNLDSWQAHTARGKLPLTRSEFHLLSTLIQGDGQIYSREELLNIVWGEDAEVLDRTVDAHIMRLRKKLGPSGKHIETIRGVGYRAA